MQFEETKSVSSQRTIGLLLIGHGTRDSAGLDEFRTVSQKLELCLPAIAVQHCFLELAEPTITTGFENLVSLGVTQIVAVPMLLFAAGHAKQDIPNTLATCQQKFPSVEVRQADHLGCHGSLIQLSTHRIQAAWQQPPASSAKEKPLVILVGRGNQDASAQAEMRKYAELLHASEIPSRVEVCYLAMAQPTFDATLAAAATAPESDVIVLPHLLFHGELLNTLRRKVEQVQLQHPGHRWHLAEHLGPDELVVETVCQRFQETHRRLSPEGTDN